MTPRFLVTESGTGCRTPQSSPLPVPSPHPGRRHDPSPRFGVEEGVESEVRPDREGGHLGPQVLMTTALTPPQSHTLPGLCRGLTRGDDPFFGKRCFTHPPSESSGLTPSGGHTGLSTRSSPSPTVPDHPSELTETGSWGSPGSYDPCTRTRPNPWVDTLSSSLSVKQVCEGRVTCLTGVPSSTPIHQWDISTVWTRAHYLCVYSESPVWVRSPSTEAWGERPQLDRRTEDASAYTTPCE